MEKTTNDHIHLDVVNITNRNITPDSTGLFMVNAITEKGYEGYNATTKEKVYFYDGDAVGVETWGSFQAGINKNTEKQQVESKDWDEEYHKSLKEYIVELEALVSKEDLSTSAKQARRSVVDIGCANWEYGTGEPYYKNGL